MKKAIVWMLCLLLALNLAACGSDEISEEQMITRPAEESGSVLIQEEAVEAAPEAAPAQAAAAPAALGNYTFVTNGVELVPGVPFDPGILPEAVSVYEVPSCAIVGTDNLYNYGSFELTAFDDGTNELIYSILLTDPNITTTEGLALGDGVDKMVALYGEGYTQQGNAYTYTGDAEILYIIVQNDFVASIEYRMIVE